MIVALLTCLMLATTLLSCISDVQRLRIPNTYVLIVLGSFAVAFALSPSSFGVWWHPFAAGGVFLVITYVMFAFNMLGAGDAKLGAALALWVGLPGLMAYVMYMAIVGGLLGVASLFLKKRKPFKNPREGSWVATVQGGGNAVPYGIAITTGAWGAMLHNGFIFHQIDELIKIIH
ncbi:MAG: prepilin peptidase [Alphaproteobacteria bacterium]|nr:prepilin peptidase [Alphaproteobacteria bacterium]